MADQMIFKRCEIKYMLDITQAELLKNQMKQYMIADEHGVSTICSLYFDTPDYLLIQRSMEHPVYKEKLRLRSYGTADKDTTVFVELKKKYESVVYKRRIAMTEDEAERYLLFHEKMRGLAAVAVMFFLWKIPESRENMGLFAMTGVFGFLLEPSVVAAILHKEKYEMYQVNVLICWISPLNQAVYGKHNFGYDPLLPTIWQSCMFFAGILFVLMILALRRMKKYPFEFLGEKT